MPPSVRRFSCLPLVLLATAVLVNDAFAADEVQRTPQVQPQSESKTQKENERTGSRTEPAKPDEPPLATTPKDKRFLKEAQKKSPSFQEKKWTGTQAGFESFLEYNYVGGASQNLGNGHNEKVTEHYADVRHQFLRHTLLAFVVEGGLEYQHQGFSVPNMALIPDRLDEGIANIYIDTRWSENDLLHLQARPGFYTDWGGSGGSAINCPVDIGYTRVTSKRLQWVVGFSWNKWRSTPFLGAAGFRWQMTPRWKLKFYLPQPDIEFAARPDLTLSFGADVRGDSYRVGPKFGDNRGHPEFNNALVDYQEVRVGPGVSWNVRPLIELNLMTGYMVGREFNFHNNPGGQFNSSGGPFVMFQVHWLMKFPGAPLQIPQRNQISVHDLLSYF
jgi:hypothetical protein